MILVLHQDFFPILLNPVLRLHDKFLAYMTFRQWEQYTNSFWALILNFYNIF